MNTVRFDLRAPGKAPAEIAALYRAAVEMAAYLDRAGGFSLAASEHHASPDGYLSSPLLLAAAFAAVTERVPIMAAATLLPLYDPVRLAEEMVVLDHLSRGRVSYVLALGYRPEEYELYGLDYAARGRLADAKLEALLDHLRRAREGRALPRVTPPPFSPAGPALFWGGGSAPAARRAARFGLGFLAQKADPALAEIYAAACRAAGREPGPCFIPPAELPGVVFVADDVERGWRELGPHLLADAKSYAEWNRRAGLDAVNLSRAETVEELRAENGNYRVVDVAGALELIGRFGRLSLHPLCGGVPPQIAWPYLRRVVEEVLPAARRRGLIPPDPPPAPGS